MEAQQYFAIGLYISVLVVVVPLGLVWTAERRANLVRLFSLRHGLAVPPAAQPMAERLLVAQRRGGAAAFLVGFTAVCPALYLGWPSNERDGLGSLSALFVMLAVFSLQWLGGAVAVVLAERPAPDAPRVARLSEARLADYLPPALRWWGPGMLVVAGLVTAAYVASPPRRDGWISPGGALAGLGLAVVVEGSSQVVARGLLHAPQPAEDAAGLAVRDVVKGELLASLALGFASQLLVAALVLERFPGQPALPLVVAALFVPQLVLHADQRRRVRRLVASVAPTRP